MLPGKLRILPTTNLFTAWSVIELTVDSTLSFSWDIELGIVNDHPMIFCLACCYCRISAMKNDSPQLGA